MAGDWIKFEHATVDKPEVLEMAELLGTSSDDVVGKLLRVWIWFDKQSSDGNAGGVTENALMRFIDRLVGSQGFAGSMKKVGWLTDSGIPNFTLHNGESSKKRALTNDRVKRSRNAVNVTEALPEKRREEKKETTTAALPEWVPKDAWDAFVEMRQRIRAPLTERGKALAVAELAKLRADGHEPRARIDEAVLKGWKSFYPPKDGKPSGLPRYT